MANFNCVHCGKEIHSDDEIVIDEDLKEWIVEVLEAFSEVAHIESNKKNSVKFIKFINSIPTKKKG